jgi:hypothetical protein
MVLWMGYYLLPPPFPYLRYHHLTRLPPPQHSH